MISETPLATLHQVCEGFELENTCNVTDEQDGPSAKQSIHEPTNQLTDLEELDEEMLMRAIAMSLQ